MFPTDVGCNGSETNLTSCCASEISSNSYYCHSGAYAGVICKACMPTLTVLLFILCVQVVSV